MTPSARAPRTEELLIHPRCVLAALEPADAAADAVRQALAAAGLAEAALGGLLADSARMADPRLRAAAEALGVPLRFLAEADPPRACVAPCPPPNRSAADWRWPPRPWRWTPSASAAAGSR
ncbi:Cobalamin biosynthesis protein CbiG [Pseudomonas paraeruginosa]|nr:Cobalamin biosynthesis protein CbiG [Pseudomonas aeruginosa]